VDLRDAEKGAGGSFGMTVALLPVLQSARADADEHGELSLAETEFLTDSPCIGRFESGRSRGFLFATQDRAAFLETGGELLEEFVFHGYSVSMMDFNQVTWREKKEVSLKTNLTQQSIRH
jgi:hypothetical protein